MLTAFGAVAVTLMLVTYWLESRSNWFVLAFAGGCALTATYSAFAAAYPITAIESVWAVVAIGRWNRRRIAEAVNG